MLYLTLSLFQGSTWPSHYSRALPDPLTISGLYLTFSSLHIRTAATLHKALFTVSLLGMLLLHLAEITIAPPGKAIIYHLILLTVFRSIQDSIPSVFYKHAFINFDRSYSKYYLLLFPKQFPLLSMIVSRYEPYDSIKILIIDSSSSLAVPVLYTQCCLLSTTLWLLLLLLPLATVPGTT